MALFKDITHIDLKWEKDGYKPKEWNLIFEKDLLMKIKPGPWWQFGVYQYISTESGSWRVKKNGKDPFIYEFSKQSLLGTKEFEVGFKKKKSQGMFNPNQHVSFDWHKLDGKAKGMAWHLDGLEVIRFEKVGRSYSKFNYSVSITNKEVNERWVAAMVAAGFMALR